MEEDTGEAAKDRMRWVRAYVPYINKRKKKHFCHNHIYTEDNCWYLFMQSDQSRNYVTAKNCFLIILTHGAKHTHFDQGSIPILTKKYTFAAVSSIMQVALSSKNISLPKTVATK